MWAVLEGARAHYVLLEAFTGLCNQGMNSLFSNSFRPDRFRTSDSEQEYGAAAEAERGIRASYEYM